MSIKIFGLFFLTAIAEILGCFFLMRYTEAGMKGGYNTGIINLMFSAVCLVLFAWLLTLHPGSAGRVYATYGGIYVFTAMLWLWLVDGVKPTSLDLIGGALVLLGAFVIASQYLLPRS